jgi:hypothetical protein
VLAQCFNCAQKRLVLLAELVRTVNSQAKHVEFYHCPKCYRGLPSVRQAASEASLAALPKILSGASKRSKQLWADPDYRAKKMQDSQRLSADPTFAAKISASISEKFSTDQDYASRVAASRRNKTAEFFSRCSDMHDGLYDYSATVYSGIDVPFIVGCSRHGKFTQLPANHVRGHGCPQCSADRSRLSGDEFFRRCVVVHNGRYDYSDSVYESSLNYVTYKCPVHGSITQLAQNHFRGSGCRFCDAAKTSSKGESELAEFVGSICSCSRNDRSALDGEEIDILAGRVGIEYHGVYWHSYNRPETREESYRHYHKLDKAVANGLSLIQIYETEWLNKPQIIKSMLRAKLGVIPRRIYARECSVSVRSESEMSEFFTVNHLHGHRKASHYLVLVYNGSVVAAASFTRINGRWELMRFCNMLDTIVVGGLGRLIKRSNLGNIFTYVDRRYSSSAASYCAAGFTSLGVTAPGYCYCKGQKLFPRQMFQKHKLHALLADYDPNRTESANMFANGYRRLWDAGHYRMEIK